MRDPKPQVLDASSFDQAAAKESAHLDVNGDLLRRAAELRIDLSAILEDALATEVRQRQSDLWLRENREAIQAYNEHVAEHGVFSDGLRGF